LQLPGIEALAPGQASFEVEVPSAVSFKPEEYPVTVIGGGGPERQETRTRWVSDPWPVDITLDIAGYRLHFTQAQVEHNENSDPPYLLFLDGEPPARGKGEPGLSGLHFSTVERPDGETFLVDPALQNSGAVSYPYGVVGMLEPGSSRLQAVIIMDVATAERNDLLPGRCRVEINGATVWVPGPWELSFSLSGR